MDEKDIEKIRKEIISKKESNNLVNRICNEILNSLGKDSGFYAKKTVYSCIHVSKESWLNKENKGVHYEVWCDKIGEGNLPGSKGAEFWIGLHIEGRNVFINKVIHELEKIGICKTFRYIVEQRKMVLSFDTEEAVSTSIGSIVEVVKELDAKYTEKIDWAVRRV